uniref:Uncharacterized protein n=1 Tax=uncultured marine virus TaxID=186617 RepID=A0A0F7LCL3_9VIRU|nr:hypothetical protein [uncultured marine virus]
MQYQEPRVVRLDLIPPAQVLGRFLLPLQTLCNLVAMQALIFRVMFLQQHRLVLRLHV